MKTLVMDTASKYLYFAFSEDGQVFYEVFDEGKNNHSDNLLKKIENGLHECNLKLKDFSKIIVGIGPGSYTGLRVSVTVAKMLAWTLNIPLYTTSSLKLLGSGYFDEDGVYSITLKAKKNHVYFTLLEVKAGIVKVVMDDAFMEESMYLELVKEYHYRTVNEENYKIKIGKLILEKVDNLHQLTPNYIQKEI